MWGLWRLSSVGLELGEEGSSDLRKGWKGAKLGAGVEGGGQRVSLEMTQPMGREPGGRKMRESRDKKQE